MAETEAVPTTTTILLKNIVKTEQVQRIIKKPVISLDSKLIISKLPTTVGNTMKRSISGATETTFKSSKYSLQTIASTGTSLTSFQWQPTAGGTTITPTKKQQLGVAINSLPPNTIIQAKREGGTAIPVRALVHANGRSGTAFRTFTTQSSGDMGRPTIFLKRDPPKRTIRSVTLELIENNPFVHLGVNANRLPLLKGVICNTSNVAVLDCYLTLKKLRQNEEFALLADYFEMNELEAQKVFARTIVKLARYLRFLVSWPSTKAAYYDRHKDLPYAFRENLSHVQSLVECVETEMQRCDMDIDCSNYKFILSIMPNGIISYISEAFVGHNDDLTIISASDFKNVIPKYLSLMVDPGKGIRRKRKPPPGSSQPKSADTDSTTDSADESADDSDVDGGDDGRTLSKYAATRLAAETVSHQTLNVVNSELTSRKVKNFSIPMMRVKESVCRLQIRHITTCLREFKILQPYAIQEPVLYQYLNEVLVVTAALTNLQR